MFSEPLYLYYGIVFFILMYALYKLFTQKTIKAKWMMVFSIIIAIFPFAPLALLSGMMSLFGLFDMHLLKAHGALSHFGGVLLYLGGPIGFTGFLKALLGTTTIAVFWMLVYGLASYIGLILLFMRGMIVEGSFVEFYKEALTDENTLLLFTGAALGTLYVCFTLWVWSWHVVRLYNVTYKRNLNV